jgi:hypothetical protein
MLGRVRWVFQAVFSAAVVLVASTWPFQAAVAQDGGRLEGIVVDQRTMAPVEGVAVSVSDQGSTQVTGADGNFSFPMVPVGVVQVRVQREGYSSTVQQVEVVPRGGTFLQLSITPITAILDELLVDVRSRRSPDEPDVVDPSDSGSGTTAADLLSQRFPWVTIDRGTGAVGGGATVRIRGLSSVSAAREPAIFLDGVRLNPSRPPDLGLRTTPGLQILDEIPASQVQSIRILRGPSASVVYGESADGVILIVTNRGGV